MSKNALENAKAGFLQIRAWCNVSGLSGYVPNICEQQVENIEKELKRYEKENSGIQD